MTDTFDLGVDGLLNIPPPHETALKVSVLAKRGGKIRERYDSLKDPTIWDQTVTATGITP